MPESPTSKRRRGLPVGLKLFVSLGLLTLLLARTDLGLLGERLLHVSLGWLAAALGVYGLTLLVGTWRWGVLLEAQAISISAAKLSESFLVATFFNNFLPSNIGGDVVRVADTVPYIGSKTVATTIVLVDRGLGLLALFAVAAAGSIVASQAGLDVPGVAYLWLLLALGLAGAVGVFLAPRGVARLLRPVRIIRPEWVDERLERLSRALERFVARPAELGLAFAGALGVQVMLVGFYMCTAEGLAAPIPLAVGAVLVPVSLVAQMLPVSLNGLGVREAVFTYFFASMGQSIESALALSLVGAGLITLLSMSGGALFLLRARRGNPRTPVSRYET
jgi:uncharacterized membrane protein YbhN (UPF0104 family)